MAAAEADAGNRRGRLAIGLSLFVLAAAVRLYRLDQGLWYDEVMAVVHFFRAPWLTLFTRMPDPAHHPLYSILGKLALLGLGEKEWAVRLPALLAGAAAAPALFFFVERHVSRTAAGVAAIILVFSMWHVWFSQDARGYSLMALLVILSDDCFLRLRDDRRTRLAAAYVLFTAAAVYTHAYTIMVLAAQLLIGFGLLRRDRRPLILALAALALAAALYAPFAREAFHFARTEGANITGRDLTPAFLLNLVSGWAAGEQRLLFSLPFFGLALAGLWDRSRRKPALVVLLLLPLALGAAFALATRTFVYTRFFLFGLPGFLLLVGAGADLTARALRRPRLAAALAAVLVLLCLPALEQYYRLGKQGLRPSAQWIAKNAPAAPVWSVGLADKVYFYYCPRARSLRRSGQGLDQVKGSIVAVVHPWSAGRANLEYLGMYCGPPLVFPAAGYYENRVLLFDCR